MRLVIVTGLSGAGKSTALKMLEDARYFCVDNLPIPLLSKFVSLMAGMQDVYKRQRQGCICAVKVNPHIDKLLHLSGVHRYIEIQKAEGEEK